MQVAKDQYRPVSIYGQRIFSLCLQVHLPILNSDPTRLSELVGLIQSLPRSVTARDPQPFLGEKDPIAAVAAGKVENGTR